MSLVDPLSKHTLTTNSDIAETKEDLKTATNIRYSEISTTPSSVIIPTATVAIASPTSFAFPAPIGGSERGTDRIIPDVYVYLYKIRKLSLHLICAFLLYGRYIAPSPGGPTLRLMGHTGMGHSHMWKGHTLLCENIFSHYLCESNTFSHHISASPFVTDEGALSPLSGVRVIIPTGGSPNGGSPTGGSPTGGSPNGGSSNGRSPNGGSERTAFAGTGGRRRGSDSEEGTASRGEEGTTFTGTQPQVVLGKVFFNVRETDVRETDVRETDVRETDVRETNLHFAKSNHVLPTSTSWESKGHTEVLTHLTKLNACDIDSFESDIRFELSFLGEDPIEPEILDVMGWAKLFLKLNPGEKAYFSDCFNSYQSYMLYTLKTPHQTKKGFSITLRTILKSNIKVGQVIFSRTGGVHFKGLRLKK